MTAAVLILPWKFFKKCFTKHLTKHTIPNFYDRMEASLVHTAQTGNESPRGRMHMTAGLHKQITLTIHTQTRFLMYCEHAMMQYIKRITVKFMLRHTNYFYDSTKAKKKSFTNP